MPPPPSGEQAGMQPQHLLAAPACASKVAAAERARDKLTLWISLRVKINRTVHRRLRQETKEV